MFKKNNIDLIFRIINIRHTDSPARTTLLVHLDLIFNEGPKSLEILCTSPHLPDTGLRQHDEENGFHRTAPRYQHCGLFVVFQNIDLHELKTQFSKLI